MTATVHHGDNREWLATLDDDSFDVLTSDPPFAQETHKGARSVNDTHAELLTFDCISLPILRDTLALAGTKVRRWVVVHTDVGHAVALRDNPPAGLRFVRIGAWVKPNGAPQFTGDRPAMGWEAMAWLHRDGVGRMTWNGGGRDAVFIVPRVNGTNKTTKPLKLCRDLLSLITDGSGDVLDPWCGEGKYGVAAVERGLGYAGCDIDPVMVQIARDALSATSAQPDLFTRTKPKQGALEL